MDVASVERRSPVAVRRRAADPEANSQLADS